MMKHHIVIYIDVCTNHKQRIHNDMSDINSQFIVLQHNAERAGIHQDLRFKKPSGELWDSFAVKKGVPLKYGERVLAVKTHDHNIKDALTTEPITSGYGKGTYKKIDFGKCIIEKYHPSHIVVVFYGKHINGRYHFVSLRTIRGKSGALRQYLLFKGKED